eukprot:TRINITY_DN22797_c0_g1_i1.p1 TRINITY_DN22797_c0_g1~~TRINITY_DN22797_c0_g1_i1.p1  ORF type:complete len:167 (+),score=17.59 TRINITY_DN22797_c0_g1_i1:59-502(+)
MMTCHQCSRPITGEHLLVEFPDKGEIPVHEECYENMVPTCAWCRIDLTDSYIMFKGAYGVVNLHEGCKDAFVAANVNTKTPDAIKSISKPSEQRNAGSNDDRLFIDKYSTSELIAELKRRSIQSPAGAKRSELLRVLRDNWDAPITY